MLSIHPRPRPICCCPFPITPAEARCSCGHTRSKGNFMKATFEALKATYGYLTPDLWKPTTYVKPPFQEFTDYLAPQPPRASPRVGESFVTFP